MIFKNFIFVVLVQFCNSQSDSSKWVWGRNGRSKNGDTRILTGERKYNEDLVSKPLFQANSNSNGDVLIAANLRYRYEVNEGDSSYTPDYASHRPTNQYTPDSGRPTSEYVIPVGSSSNYQTVRRPYNDKYYAVGPGYRPPNGDYSLHGYRPGWGTNGRPILTGPPEEDHRRYQSYDICKCVHSFNCNTPGLKFGSCDVDKQYCCYNSKQQGGFPNGGKPSNAYERPRPRPVLAGPGGPVDYPGRPFYNYAANGRPYEDPERELNDAYNKGLSSTIYKLQTRPSAYDRDPDGFWQQNQYRGEYYGGLERPSGVGNPSKYGLYYPQTQIQARSTNSTILADSGAKNYN